MKYRDHKGSLGESLETVKDFTKIKEIKDHLNKYYNQFGKKVKAIKFKYCGFDARTNWDTYYVSKRLNGEKDFTISGFSDGVIQTKNIKPTIMKKCKKCISKKRFLYILFTIRL